MSDALCRLKANLPHQYLPDLFEVIKEYDYDIDRHMKTIHKKDDHLRTADKEIASLRAENARLQAECDRKQEWIDAVMGQPSFAVMGQPSFTNKYTYIRRPQPLVKE